MNYSQSGRLRELIEQESILILPATMDPLTAKVVETVGFPAAYLGGYSTSISKLGYPDAGFLTMPELVANAHNVRETVDIPVIADIDDGFGSATNVVRTIRECISAGIAGVQIEDQAAPKRCGHVKGKQVVSMETAIGKIQAAVDVREERDKEFVIIARSDAYGAASGSLDDAIERVNAYCEAGADVAFVEGPTTREEVKRIGREVEAPLLYNCYDMSPKLEPEAVQGLGYDIILYSVAMHAATVGMFHYTQLIMDEGTRAITELEEDLAALPIESFYHWSGFAEIAEWERRYYPDAELERYEDSLGRDPAED